MRVPHPIPYQGSKRLLAPKILQFFPRGVDTLFEPFAGSAAISLAAATLGLANQFVINDLNEPLMNLLRDIVEIPEIISDKYKDIWQRQMNDEKNYYNRIRDEFNKTKKPDLFLFLLVRCVKSSVRYNSNKEFNQSPDNRRRGTHPAIMRREIFAASAILRGKTKFYANDYTSIVEYVTERDVIYMDPPYQGVSNNRDTRYLGGLPFEDFVRFLELLNLKNMSYIVSYDGRTGNRVIGNKLPYSLELQHIELEAGRSSQATLLGRDDRTFESLYLSPALCNRIRSNHSPDDNETLTHQMEMPI